ncbi:hypothetical protein CAPTEDRAFT_207037 [Capitella teleta]|uniref:Uncharacterized protein n=1 Tax=Capitella teleta TaxID=283909 RepID=R7US40_CAPTE|nr:hypothetical protein CAPTEDRAFT_207037 [Capitella teleta]|eukprot:ELU08958.1 hypothetical protein CAPTEDRAFT_207037 [Capitella teleta]
MSRSFSTNNVSVQLLHFPFSSDILLIQDSIWYSCTREVLVITLKWHLCFIFLRISLNQGIFLLLLSSEVGIEHSSTVKPTRDNHGITPPKGMSKSELEKTKKDDLVKMMLDVKTTLSSTPATHGSTSDSTTINNDALLLLLKPLLTECIVELRAEIPQLQTQVLTLQDKLDAPQSIPPLSSMPRHTTLPLYPLPLMMS